MSNQKSTALLAQEKESFKKTAEKRAAEKESEESQANIFARVNLTAFNSTKWVDIEEYQIGTGMRPEKLEFSQVKGAIYPRLTQPKYPPLDSYAKNWYAMSYAELINEVNRANAVALKNKKKVKDGESLSDDEIQSEKAIAANGQNILIKKLTFQRKKDCEQITHDVATADIKSHKEHGVKGEPFTLIGEFVQESDKKNKIFSCHEQ